MAALAAQGQLREHEEALGRCRADLAAGGLAVWLRAGVGYAAVGCVLFLAFTLFVGGLLLHGRPSQRSVAGQPTGPGTQAAGTGGDTTSPGSVSPVGGAKKGTPVIDLKQAMGESAPLHPEAVHGYVLYGSTALVEKAILGDQFAKLQAEKEGAAHRADVATKVFCLRSLPVVVADRDDFAAKGLFLVCEVPLRLHVRNKQPGDEWSGNIRQLHPCWANTSEPWFLTEKNSLMACRDLAEADAVLAMGRFLYFPDAGDTHLILNLSVPLDLATQIAEQSDKYVVDVIFDNVKPLPTVGWGYYRKDALEKNDWNSPKLFNWNLAGGLDPTVPGPPFFRPAGKTPPTHVHADLVALTFRERTGKPTASYKRQSSYGELQMPSVGSAASPKEIAPGPDIGKPKPSGKTKSLLIKPKSKSHLKKMKDGSG